MNDVTNFINDVTSFITSSEIAGTVAGISSYLKIIFIVLTLVILGCVIFLLLKNTWLKRRLLEDIVEFTAYRPFGAKKTFKQWARIIKRLEVGGEAEYKLAVIEADSLLNDVLQKMGYEGETIGERLEQLDSTTLPNIDQIREVHKTRNNIVHNPDYNLTLDEAKKILAIYEKTFRDLELF